MSAFARGVVAGALILPAAYVVYHVLMGVLLVIQNGPGL